MADRGDLHLDCDSFDDGRLKKEDQIRAANYLMYQVECAADLWLPVSGLLGAPGQKQGQRNLDGSVQGVVHEHHRHLGRLANGSDCVDLLWRQEAY